MRDTVDALFGQLQARPRISCETEEMEVVAGLARPGLRHRGGPPDGPAGPAAPESHLHRPPRLGEEHLHVSDERIYLSPVVRNFQRFVLEQQGGETETVQKC